MSRGKRLALVLAISTGFLMSIPALPGCGRKVITKTKVGIKADQMFDRTGLVNQKRLREFLAMEAPNKEKIEVLLKIVKEGHRSMHGGAVETITLIKDPYRIDALLEIVDTYKGTETDKNIVRNWALTGLGLSFEPRAYKKLFELLDTSKDIYELSAILHELGVAPYNADQRGVEMSDELYNEIGEQISRLTQHDELSVREHASRAYKRWEARSAE